MISYRNDEGAAADPSGYYQYGVSEWRDLEAALASAAESGAGDVVLYGYSTGAAVAMAYMERVPNSAVIGAVFDSPNIDFATTVDYNAAARDLPFVGLPVPGSLAWAARTITAIRIDIDWDAIDYIDRVDRLAVPVLVFHGTDDSSVPIETSRRLAEASNLVELVEVEGAEHVQSWNAGPEDYQRRVLEGIATMEATAGS